MATAGDWLLVRARTDSTHHRRGQILQARGPQGGPPYLVRWLDSGTEALVFPGPDSQVMSEAAVCELERQQLQRISRVQAEISGDSRAATSHR